MIMNLITKHLNENVLTCKIHDVNTICSYSGQRITKGIKFNDLIGDTFTDREIFKWNSGYLGIDFALLTQPVIRSEKQLNALRNYSFLATEQELKLLSRDEMLNVLMSMPDGAFQIAITYSNKKHIAHKTPINFSKYKFIVCTDTGMVEFDTQKAKQILPIIQSWYTISKDTKQEPTYFTKSDILGETEPGYTKISEYGVEKYFNETIIIEKYRNTSFLKLLVHVLNKK